MQHVVRTLATIRFALSTRRDLLLEMLALRHQFAVLARSNRRFRAADRLLWLILRRVWSQWRDALVLVQPATVDRWHRDRFVRRWWRRSRRPGRPRIDSPCRDLIRRLAEENRLWGAPRIHGELLKLGVSERTVSRCLRERPKKPSRPGAHLLRITSASSNAIPKCCHRPCRAMTSSPCPVRATQFRAGRLPPAKQCAMLDGCASARRACLGLPCVQDHLRERTGMRRSAGRAPPRTGCVQPTHGGHAEGGFVALALDQLQPVTAGDRCGSPIAIGASIIGTSRPSAMRTSAW